MRSSRNMNRKWCTSGPVGTNCHCSAIGKFITVDCTQIAKRTVVLWVAVLEQQGWQRSSHARATSAIGGCSRDGKHNAGLAGFARIDQAECNLHRQLAGQTPARAEFAITVMIGLVELCENYPDLWSTMFQRYCTLHAVYHDRSHDNGVNNVLRICFWHFVFSFCVCESYFLITVRNAAERKK